MCSNAFQVKKSVTDFSKSLEKPSSEKVSADEGVYYLVSPDGAFVQAFGHDEDATAIALAVRFSAPSSRLCLTPVQKLHLFSIGSKTSIAITVVHGV